MRNTKLKPLFHMSFGALAQLGSTSVSLSTRDHEVLLQYGVDEVYINMLKDLTEDVKHFSTDENMAGDAKDHREAKDLFADTLKVNIRMMMVRVRNAFPANSSKPGRFGTDNLDKMTDLALIKCGFRVVRMANEFLADLAPKGITQVDIDALETDANNMDQAWDEQQYKTYLRTSVTHDRLLLANELYSRIMELYDYGKNYWVTRNSAYYKDYIIYDTPKSKPKKAKKKADEAK